MTGVQVKDIQTQTVRQLLMNAWSCGTYTDPFSTKGDLTPTANK